MPIQIGFLGAGAMARSHALALQTLDAQIVAVCDLSAPKAAEFSEDFGAEIYSSANRMLNGAALDALYICTPPSVRGPVEIAAAKLGIALFIETPVALNLRTAQSVASAITKNGVLCSVGGAWRYAESTTRLRKIFAPKNAPAPQILSARWLEPPLQSAWRLDAKQSGGLWLDGGYAALDLMRVFGGEIKKVSAFSVSDSLKTAILQFGNGALGHLSVGSTFENAHQREFSIASSDALHFLWNEKLETRRGEESFIFCGRDDALLAQNAAWIRSLNTGKKAEIRNTYADAMKTLRLGLALNRKSFADFAVNSQN
ncbi:putative dehydrogenase [Abditibacterium utsteinense]|uniref:Putative dehydrogenase n=1 Tax=Abditibacterium utsteinense TaxID=1960156 RepID=A0A2S8SV07_9BACT|nr:Gfo/Idh/MocA family oxidoreductase [Abditibacterium utsteinense]PQV64614.1 putative dehydrogenase [Abditibacterium utsteinense]